MVVVLCELAMQMEMGVGADEGAFFLDFFFACGLAWSWGWGWEPVVSYSAAAEAATATVRA